MSDSTRPMAALAVLATAYAVALGAGLAAAAAIPGAGLLARGAAASAVATLVVFVASRLCDNSSVYDPYWSVAPPALGWSWAAATPGALSDPRALVALALVTLWGGRLTWNFLRGWPGLHHEDWRYVDLRRQSGGAYWLVSLLGVHGFPTVQTFLGSLPVLLVITHAGEPLGWLDLIALDVTAAGILLETIADEQLRRHARSATPGGPSLQSGLWGWCRHPNYLGEMTFWWGLGLFGLAAAPPGWSTFTGAAAITAMFFVVSIPMKERRMRARRPDYGALAARIPLIIPRPPRHG